MATPAVSNRCVKKTPIETRRLTHYEKTEPSFFPFFAFSISGKVCPTKEMRSIALIVVHVKKRPQRSKRFNQLLKSKFEPLTACARS